MWNYRVIKKKLEEPRHEETFYIHEVYYNKNKEIVAMSEEPMYPFGETVDELMSDLNHMMKAFTREILDYGTIEFAKADWNKEDEEE